MKKWKIKGGNDFQRLLGRLKSDKKVTSYWDGNGRSEYYFNIDNKVLYSYNSEEKSLLISEHEEVTVEELEQLYYPTSTIEKWSVGSYVVFCKDFTSVCPIGFVDKIITGLDVTACVHLEKYLTLHINRENDGEVKWFATKQEAEDFAKTLTTVTDMEDFKVGDWVYAEKFDKDYRDSKYIPIFQVKGFNKVGGDYLRPVADETTGIHKRHCRKALPHEIPSKTMETIEEIQAECKRRFPIGCKFKSPSTGEIYTLNQTNSTYELVGQHAINGGVNQSYLYYNGEYAELFSEPEHVEPVKSKYLIAAEKALKHFEDAGFYVGCEYESTKGTIYKSICELTIYSKDSKDCNIDCGGGFLWEYERNGQTNVYGKLLIEDKPMEDKPQSMEREYQVGDRVECVNKYAHISVGMQGVIVEVSSVNIGVSWDTLTKGHGCNGNCAVGTGYYIMRNNVRLISTSLSTAKTTSKTFKINDRVKCVKATDKISVGMQGTIVCFGFPRLGVSWDTLTNGHSCYGKTTRGKGWNVAEQYVEHISSTMTLPLELNTYGLKIGDKLDRKIINEWVGITDNRSVDKGKWHQEAGSFVSDRTILAFHLIHGHVGFEVSGTGTVYLKAKGFKEFADNYYSKESKQDCFEMFDIVECVEARGPIKIGMQGVIREMNYKDKPAVGVEWFNFDNGHDLDKILQTNSGYRLDYDQVKLISRSNLSLNSLGYSSESKVDYDKRVGTIRWEPPRYEALSPQQLQDRYAVTMHQREQLIQKESNQTQELLTLPTNKIYVRKSKSIK